MARKTLTEETAILLKMQHELTGRTCRLVHPMWPDRFSTLTRKRSGDMLRDGQHVIVMKVEPNLTMCFDWGLTVEEDAYERDESADYHHMEDQHAGVLVLAPAGMFKLLWAHDGLLVPV